ncbi:hypothetical protein, partial [Pseudomonas aeruginosa]
QPARSKPERAGPAEDGGALPRSRE